MADAKPKGLNDLFLETVKDIYFAEKQILKSLPKMAKAAQSPELKKAFETHRDQTEGQIERLEQVFELLGKPARGKTCDAILGILEEGKEVMEDFKGMPALDAGLLAGARPSSTTRSRATAPWSLGPRRWAWPTRPSFCSGR